MDSYERFFFRKVSRRGRRKDVGPTSRQTRMFKSRYSDARGRPESFHMGPTSRLNVTMDYGQPLSRVIITSNGLSKPDEEHLTSCSLKKVFPPISNWLGDFEKIHSSLEI